MWGMIARITTVPGNRDTMIEVLRESAGNMSGCLEYLVAKDAADENVLWVTEAWDNQASHEASLTSPQVQTGIAKAAALVAKFEKIAVTQPVWLGGS